MRFVEPGLSIAVLCNDDDATGWRSTLVADDRFEIRFRDLGLSGPQLASLEFDLGLSSGSERGIIFERR